jgi:Trypsin
MKQTPPNAELEPTNHHSLMNRVLAVGSIIGATTLAIATGVSVNSSDREASHATIPAPLTQKPNPTQTNKNAPITPDKHTSAPEKNEHTTDEPGSSAKEVKDSKQNTSTEHDKFVPEEPKNIPWAEMPKPPTIQAEDVPPPPAQYIELRPNTEGLSERVRNYFKANVAYNIFTNPESPTGWFACSALLVRNEAGEPIGEQTARHCLPEPIVNDYGQTVIPFSQAPRLFTGDSKDSLKELPYQVHNFALPNDHARDHAIIAFDDHDPQEVNASLNAMTEDEITQLPVGTVLANSGWPGKQPNVSGALKRQEMTMQVIGTSNVENVTGYGTVKSLIVAVAGNKDGAICSPGDSGSPVVYEDPTSQSVRVVGNMSYFNSWAPEFNPDAEQAKLTKAYFENTYKVKLDGFSAICGISYGPADVNIPIQLKDTYEAPEVGTPPLSPEYISIQEKTDQAIEDFNNPDVQKTVIDGVLTIEGGKETVFVDKPVVFYDNESDSVIVGYNVRGEFITQYFDRPDLLLITARQQDEAAGLHLVSGELTTSPEDADDFGEYTTANQYTFGQLLKVTPTEIGEQYALQPADNGLQLVPITSNK